MRREIKTISARSNRVCGVLFVLLLTFFAAGIVFADSEETEQLEVETTDSQDSGNVSDTHEHVALNVGYRFVTPDGLTAAASPYGRQKSGVIGGFSAGTLGSDLKLSVDGSFLHADDYHTELFFDYNGMLRFHAESQALWHNLLREQVNPGTLPLIQNDQGLDYGVRTAISQAETRIRLGNRPAHLNLGYWELKREGFEQKRFSDYYFSPPTNGLITESNRVDRTTREGNIGLDANLGLFNLGYGFRIRDFTNNAPDPVYAFTNNADGYLILGNQAHNVIPDSRVTSHTVKLFSDLSGGLVGSATYSLTQRENNGGHGEAVPSVRPADLIQSAAADLSYTPSKRYSFALKYRHREIDRTSPASLFYPYAAVPANSPVYTAINGQLLVRPSTSSARDTITLSGTFRSTPKIIYRLEYNADLESRSNILNAQTPAESVSALHSDRRQTHTGTASFYWRPYAGTKLNASYSYATCNNPAYVASFGEQHTGKLLLTYTGNGKWGATGSYIARYESGEASALTAPDPNLVVPETAVSIHLPRTSRNNSVNASIWFSPLDKLTISTGYSFLQSDIDQTLLLAEQSLNALAATNYRSTAHVYGIDAVYAATERLDLSFALQQVRSSSHFNVPANAAFSVSNAPNPPTLFSSAGISSLTRIDSTETSVSARADWRFSTLFSCAMDYSFRQYDSGNPAYDGSVHTTMLSLKARW